MNTNAYDDKYFMLKIFLSTFYTLDFEHVIWIFKLRDHFQSKAQM